VQKIRRGAGAAGSIARAACVHYVAEGKGRTIINDVAYEWEAGDLVQLPYCRKA
jgi:gentisate 1,2-dioxygenase